MKPKKNLLGKILSGLALCTMIFIVACQQEMNPVPNQMDSDEILTNAGKIHNEMISYYYSNRMSESASSEDMLSEVLDLSWEYLDKNGYDSEDIPETKLSIERKIDISCLKSITDDGYSINIASFMSQLSETAMYSPCFLEEINKVLTFAHIHDDRQTVRDYVQSTFININFEDDEDKAAQQLFVNIFSGSYDFWETMDASQLKSTNWRRNSWVIINDGIGAIIGMVFGPVGSIVTATAFSVATNEEIRK
ncbi:MAG: hypothetical protein KAR19_04500 [Bacteroidales bacterium]|nr:hypothetical protein [Bacteroidales bacterium]